MWNRLYNYSRVELLYICHLERPWEILSMTAHLSSALSKEFNDGYRPSVLEATECPIRCPRLTCWESSWHKHAGETKAEQQTPVSVECIDTQQLEGVEWFQVVFKGQANLFSAKLGETATGSWPCRMQPVRYQAARVNLYVIWLSFGLSTAFVHVCNAL